MKRNLNLFHLELNETNLTTVLLIDKTLDFLKKCNGFEIHHLSFYPYLWLCRGNLLGQLWPCFFRYLSDLHAPGDPAWQCIGAQHRWILQLMHSCKEGYVQDLKGKAVLFQCIMPLYIVILTH